VEGTKELAEFPRLVHQLNGRESQDTQPRYPDVLATLDAGQLRQLGEQFIADTRIYRSTDRPCFIDKMPNNFRHIGADPPDPCQREDHRCPAGAHGLLFQQLQTAGLPTARNSPTAWKTSAAITEPMSS